MKTVRPTYYKDFNCIAGACDFTCCKEWDICVDPNTLKRWKQLGMKVEKYVKPGLGGDYLILNKDRKCQLLTEDGLCSMVLKYGEGVISKTCHTYPREVRQFEDRQELSLAMGCPEALRLLWSRESFKLEDEEEENLTQCSIEIEGEQEDGLAQCIRSNLMNLMQNKDFSAGEAIKAGFFILLDFKKNEKNLDKEYVNAQFDRGILAQLKQAMAGISGDSYANISEQNELFLDLAESYRNKKMYASLLEPLAAMAEELEDEKKTKEFLKDRAEFEIFWQQLDAKMKLLFAQEIYSSLFLPGNDISKAVLKLEWIGIIYASLKQCLFLEWKRKRRAGIQGEIASDNSLVLSDEDLSKIVVMIIRMAGYSQEEVFEYLENSFQSPVWEWSYMNLII